MIISLGLLQVLMENILNVNEAMNWAVEFFKLYL